MTRNYLLVKNKFNKEIAYIDYDRVSGFKFKPVNKGDNTISVNQMVIISPTFIEKVLTRKTKRKLELYLEFIVKLLDEDDDTDITGLRSALNDITRYKDIVMHKYRVYLEQKYYELFMKKLSLLEYELKMKILHYKDNVVDTEIKENYNYQEKEQTSEISDEVKDNIANINVIRKTVVGTKKSRINKQDYGDGKELQKLKEQAYENTMEEERKVR